MLTSPLHYTCILQYYTILLYNIIIQWTCYLFSDWPQAHDEFSKSVSTCDIITADYTIIMSRTLEVTGNHVMNDPSAWFLKVIMSSWCTLCSLLSVKKQKHDFDFFLFNVLPVFIWHHKNSNCKTIDPPDILLQWCIRAAENQYPYKFFFPNGFLVSW